MKPLFDELSTELPQNKAHPALARHFVFIDVRVPDLDTLVHGTANDREIHVLAADRDGLRQIADILAACAASALSSIAIVAHGAPGVLTIGDMKLSAADLESRAAMLAAIGNALAPAGRIDLYACDLAAGPQGRQFISEFARQTGVPVAGASHRIGSEAGNGSWALDVTTGGGAIDVPFIAAARAAHRGVLTDPTIDTQLFYTLNRASGGSSVLRLDLNSVTNAVIDAQQLYGTTHPLMDVAIDTASGVYFVVNKPVVSNPVLEGQLNQPDAIQNFDIIPLPTVLAIDPISREVYATENSQRLVDVYQTSYALLQPIATFVAQSPNPVSMAFDPANQRLFIVTGDGRFGTAGTIASQSNSFVDSPFNPGGLTSLAYAPSVISQPVLVFTQGAINGHSGAVLLYKAAGNSANYTVLYSEDTPGSGPHGTLKHIAIDAQHALYYVTDEGEADPDKNGIYVGSLFDLPGTAPTRVLATGSATFGGLTLNSGPQLLFIAGGTASEAVQGAADPVAVLGGLTPHIRDDASPRSGSDIYAMLASATVYISDARAGDQLYAAGLQSGTLDNGKITIAWNETAHVLTLSGRDTVAAYTAALNSVGYADLGADTTTLGHAQRHFEFTVNDGQLDSSTREAALTIDRPPTVVADTATADQILQISHNVLANDIDPDGDTIVVSVLTGGNVGTLFHATFGDFKLNANGIYTYFAGATADEQAALAAVPNGAHAVETFIYTASDGLGGFADTTLTITIDRAMVLTTPASVTYLAGSAPVALALAGTIGSVDAASLDTGWLSIAGANLSSGDQLTILSDGIGAGQISVVGTAVFYQGLEIGAIDSIANGHNGAGLTIYFNTSATVEAAQALLEHLQFSNSDSGPTLGARTLTLQFRDSLGHLTASFETVDVTTANQAPSFTAGANQIVNEDSGAHTVAAWASSIFPGAANESGQTLDFLVSTDNPGLFAIAPAIAPDGTLTYTPAADANGSATIRVKLHDGGGTASGGSDTSAEQTFTITVAAVNDAPSFAAGSGQSVNEDSGAHTVAGWATSIAAGPSNESGQSLDFRVSNDNAALFAIAPVVAPDGTLTYTPAHDASGSAIVTVQLHDNGGIANGGTDLSASQSFVITVNPANDAPVLSGVSAQVIVPPGGGALTLSPHLTVSDVDSATLVAASVHSAGAFAAHGDVLAVSAGALAGTSIVASYNAVTETLTLSGTDTLAHYTQALEHVTFQTSNFGIDHAQTIAWQVDDGSAANNLSALAVTAISLPHPPANDFNGDGHGDILWQTDGGQLAGWEMNGVQIGFADYTRLGQSSVGLPGADWHVADTGDFDGDGKSDLLWRTDSGALAIWEMDGTHIKAADFTKLGSTSVGTPGADWHVLGAADFDGDGKSDLLWRTDSGALAIWEMNGTQIKGADYTKLGSANVGIPAADWHIVGTGDFDGDGRSDLLWQTDSGALAIWEMNGTQIKAADYLKIGGSNVGIPGHDWHVIGTGDFDGDGKGDLLWQTDSGALAIWEMNGTQIKSADYIKLGQTPVGVPAPDWHFAGTSDYNGDGKSDLLWHTDSGALAIWQMDGTQISLADYTKLGSADVGAPGSDWHVFQHHYDLV
jgi:VCBS repeat-containing protein